MVLRRIGCMNRTVKGRFHDAVGATGPIYAELVSLAEERRVRRQEGVWETLVLVLA